MSPRHKLVERNLKMGRGREIEEGDRNLEGRGRGGRRTEGGKVRPWVVETGKHWDLQGGVWQGDWGSDGRWAGTGCPALCDIVRSLSGLVWLGHIVVVPVLKGACEQVLPKAGYVS